MLELLFPVLSVDLLVNLKRRYLNQNGALRGRDKNPPWKGEKVTFERHGKGEGRQTAGMEHFARWIGGSASLPGQPVDCPASPPGRLAGQPINGLTDQKVGWIGR